MRRATCLVAAALACWPALAAAATSYPGDPYFAAGDQWYLQAGAGLDATPAWCVATGVGVTIAGLNTGADFGHPDLAGRLVAGARFTSGGGDPAAPDDTGSAAVADDEGSGTGEAGVMVAATGNGVGIASVAPRAQELVVKVLNNGASGHADDVAAGLTWAAGHGASVALLDLGPRVSIQGDPRVIVDAVHRAAARGVAIAIAGGGNVGAELSSSQLRELSGDALIVGALGPTAEPASYTVHFEGVNIWAPGGDSAGGADEDADHMILTTAPLEPGPDQYQYVEGSDYAAALVAGALADLMSAGYSAAAARAQLLATTRRVGPVAEADAGRALGVTAPCGAKAEAAPTPLNAQPKNPAQPLYLNPTPGGDLGLNFVPPPAGPQPPPWLPILLPPILLIVGGGVALWAFGRRR